MALKHYIQYAYPGIFISETSEKPIKSRKEKVPKKKGAYAYRFYSREETKKKGELLWGPTKDLTGWHYFEGELLTLDDVKKQYPKEDTLIWNMENNGYKSVVRCGGQFLPFDKGDKMLNKKVTI